MGNLQSKILEGELNEHMLNGITFKNASQLNDARSNFLKAIEKCELILSNSGANEDVQGKLIECRRNIVALDVLSNLEKGLACKNGKNLQDARAHFSTAIQECEEHLKDNKNEEIKRLLTQVRGQNVSLMDQPKTKPKPKPCRPRVPQKSNPTEIRKRIKLEHSQTRILKGDIGHTYESIFGPYLNSSLSKVTVEDPYLLKPFQIIFFLRFCEMLVTHCIGLKSITLVTKFEDKIQNSQFQEIKTSLEERGIALCIVYSATLHDREITFDNGWIIKIGRGLNFYQSTKGLFVIGGMDLSLRPCMETTVDIIPFKTRKNPK